MGRKHLHELLEQDQEPFQLKNFIHDRRSQLKSTTTTDAGKTALRPRKRNPIIESTSSSTTARNFCINHVCLFSLHDSPDFKKSPFLDFPTKDMKSPCNNAAVFLHIPARTAAMLLDAATRVQKPKPSSKNIGLGLLGSLLRRLKDRSTRTKNREIGPVNATPSSVPTRRSRLKIVNDGVGVDGALSEKLSELETSCSSRSIHDLEEIECLCSNPSSPFRFSLQRTPSPTRRKPDSSSPVASPSRHFQQDNKSYEGEAPQAIHGGKDDNEKEQCSPVSVLDPLFDDDDEEHDGRVMEEDEYDIECSYASVQRASQLLLQKLQRFERLAGLDPVELEKHKLEQGYDESDDDDDKVMADEEEVNNEEFVREVFNQLGVGKIPWYMKKLVFDLISEENKNEEHEAIVQWVCKRLHSWKVVELNTIDMMIETDFGSEAWKRYDEEKVREIGVDIEKALFELLVEELAQELVKSSSNVNFKK